VSDLVGALARLLEFLHFNLMAERGGGLESARNFSSARPSAKFKRGDTAYAMPYFTDSMT